MHEGFLTWGTHGRMQNQASIQTHDFGLQLVLLKDRWQPKGRLLLRSTMVFTVEAQLKCVVGYIMSRGRVAGRLHI